MNNAQYKELVMKAANELSSIGIKEVAIMGCYADIYHDADNVIDYDISNDNLVTAKLCIPLPDRNVDFPLELTYIINRERRLVTISTIRTDIFDELNRFSNVSGLLVETIESRLKFYDKIVNNRYCTPTPKATYKKLYNSLYGDDSSALAALSEFATFQTPSWRPMKELIDANEESPVESQDETLIQSSNTWFNGLPN